MTSLILKSLNQAYKALGDFIPLVSSVSFYNILLLTNYDPATLVLSVMFFLFFVLQLLSVQCHHFLDQSEGDTTLLKVILLYIIFFCLFLYFLHLAHKMCSL